MGCIDRGSLRFIIEPIATEAQYAQVRAVRKQVFENKLVIKPAPLEFDQPPHALHLVGRLEPGGEPVAALAVLNTTGERAVHARFGLSFRDGARVARFMQPAALKIYRGVHLALLLESNFGFTAPGRFRYTWLVIGARERMPRIRWWPAA